MAAMLSAAISCTKEQIHEEESDKPEIEVPGESKGSTLMEFTAVQDLTRTAIGELDGGMRKISWVKDDEIKIIYNNKSTTAKAETTGASTIFKANVDEASDYYAVYPSSAATVAEDGTWKVAIPSKQDVSGGFGSAHYAAAVAKNGHLAFRNLCGWLRFTITDSNIKSVLIRGNGEQFLAGDLAVTFDEEGNIASKTVSNGNSRLIVNVNGSGEYYVAVLPDVNLENGVGFRFYTSNVIASENAIETGVFSSKALSVAQGKIVNLGDLDSRIVTDWWISPSGAGDGKSAESPADGVEFLRAKLAQDVTSDKTKNGLAKGYGCMGITIHAAAGEYDFGGQEINITWPGHNSSVGTTILGEEGTVFKNSGSSRFFKIGKSVDLKFENITFDGGDAGTENGGAILQNDGTAILALKNCAFKNNKASNGGAVYMAGKTLTAENTSFSDNSATTAAGAVGIAGTAEIVSFTYCDFTSNTAGKHGGALQNCGGVNTQLTVTGGTFSNNKTTDASGGGGAAITVRGAKTVTKVNGVSFNSNLGYQGAAIRVAETANVFVNACCFTGNGSNNNSATGTVIFLNQKQTPFLGVNNSTFGDNVSSSSKNTYIDVQGGDILFANSTMIGECASSIFRVHTTGNMGSFINSIVVNTLSGYNSINYNTKSNENYSIYTITGVGKNSYHASDSDKTGVSCTDLGSPVFEDNVYKWNGTLDGYSSRINQDVAAGKILQQDSTTDTQFHAWLSSINAFGVDQLGNSRSVNRQGAYCGN